MLKHQGEAIDFLALDFETVDTEMIVDETKEEERQVAEEVAYVITNIEVEVEVEIEIATVEAEIAAAGGGEATNEGVDGQTVIAFTNHPSEQG